MAKASITFEDINVTITAPAGTRLIEISEKVENGLSNDDLKKFPFPIVIYNFIEKYLK